MCCDLCGTNYTTVLKSVTVLQIRPSIRNKMQPTRSLYDIRFKSYGAISAFHVFWWPWHIPVLPICIYKSNQIPGYLHIKCCNNRLSFNKVMVWYRAANTHIHTCTYIQTDRQTDRQTHRHTHPFARLIMTLLSSYHKPLISKWVRYQLWKHQLTYFWK